MTDEANQRRWNIGCGGAIVVFICFGLFIGISEIRFRKWLSDLDERARSFHGDVYNGRRDSAADVMVSANSSETTDKHMADLADIVLECLASQDIIPTKCSNPARSLGFAVISRSVRGGERIWTDKDEPTKAAFHGNRQRMKRSKGKNLQKCRSELVERGFAHVCETGGARKTWLRGLEKVRKRHLISVAAHNLGLVMRSLFGFSKPRAFSAGSGVATLYYPAISAISALTALSGRLRACSRFLYRHFLALFSDPNVRPALSANVAFSTGC